MAKLTNEELEKRVYENSLNTCHYLSGYENRYSDIQVCCEVHNYVFTTRYENVGRSSRKHHICPLCQEEDRNKNKIKVVCDYCGKEFLKAPSKIRSEFNFCCRECKDNAQRLNSGIQFNEMRPAHYDFGKHVRYRKLALESYGSKCAVCGWDEDEDVLEVHHIDSNRANNSIDNLVVLCPLCHKKLTTKKYKLVDGHKIEKNGD